MKQAQTPQKRQHGQLRCGKSLGLQRGLKGSLALQLFGLSVAMRYNEETTIITNYTLEQRLPFLCLPHEVLRPKFPPQREAGHTSMFPYFQ